MGSTVSLSTPKTKYPLGRFDPTNSITSNAKEIADPASAVARLQQCMQCAVAEERNGMLNPMGTVAEKCFGGT